MPEVIINCCSLAAWPPIIFTHFHFGNKTAPLFGTYFLNFSIFGPSFEGQVAKWPSNAIEIRTKPTPS